VTVTFKPQDLRPSARSYKPGTYPQTFFQSLNGSTTVVQFGARNFNAELTLQFSNIEDTAADTIIGVYEKANGVWDYVDFNNTKAMDAASDEMQSRMKEGSPLKWRFKEPPTVTYKFRNRCDVSCTFTAFLDGV
jgi:hypothetical protein